MIPSAALLLAVTGVLDPSPPTRGAFEVSLLLGPSYVFGTPLPNAISDQRVAMGGAVAVFYRSRYFLTPFVDVGYGLLSQGSARVAEFEPGGPGVISNTLDAWHFSAGVAIDVWRLRLRAGAAVYRFGVASSFAGVDASTSDVSVGSVLGVSANVFRARRFHLGLDFMAHNAPQANVHYLRFGLSIHQDVFSF